VAKSRQSLGENGVVHCTDSTASVSRIVDGDQIIALYLSIGLTNQKSTVTRNNNILSREVNACRMAVARLRALAAVLLTCRLQKVTKSCATVTSRSRQQICIAFSCLTQVFPELHFTKLILLKFRKFAPALSY